MTLMFQNVLTLRMMMIVTMIAVHPTKLLTGMPIMMTTFMVCSSSQP